MLEPILTTFFCSIIYLVLYIVLPRENPVRQIFVLLVLLSVLFLSGIGLTEVADASGASEQIMEYYYGIIAVGTVLLFILYFGMMILQSIINFYYGMLEKDGRKEKKFLGKSGEDIMGIRF